MTPTAPPMTPHPHPHPFDPDKPLGAVLLYLLVIALGAVLGLATITRRVYRLLRR